MANGDFELTIVITAIDDASAVLQAVTAEIEQFDASLIVVQQDTLETLQNLAQLSAALTSGIDLSGDINTAGAEDSGALGGFNLLTGDTNPLSDLAAFSSQQPNLSGQALGSEQSASSPLQFVQNNTFNGILDPSATQDQVIPELERAVARGATLLAST